MALNLDLKNGMDLSLTSNNTFLYGTPQELNPEKTTATDIKVCHHKNFSVNALRLNGIMVESDPTLTDKIPQNPVPRGTNPNSESGFFSPPL
ncbi:hypothetical protein TNIN_159311 [Trichonephila inaurata madagascariensis]|uniref:Uncharacterized protein n=1 Tax=Trichonephila inaurata madagascariensis TaxID=2747483 RepID=A0A8X7CQA4_9ARAC|nr:hypothetical protein TNIN_159311 [Trichonephila inaurata madagascariensis]